jgi:hypothetical protein
MASHQQRERLERGVAEELYIREGELEAFRQIQRDARELDSTLSTSPARALGPFARIRAAEVVSDLGKTRGAINNLWRNQENFQAAVMAYSLSASAEDGLGMGQVTYPDPARYADLDSWVAALAAVELARGPRHGMDPDASYALRWAAWLGLAPYGVWSESVAEASLVEYRLGVEKYASPLLEAALKHFGVRLADDTTLTDLAVSLASTVEGFWLNACCTEYDPVGRSQPLSTSLAVAMRLLFRGATTPHAGINDLNCGNGDATAL